MVNNLIILYVRSIFLQLFDNQIFDDKFVTLSTKNAHRNFITLALPKRAVFGCEFD